MVTGAWNPGIIMESQPEQSVWLPGNFFDSRIPFSWIMTENRLLAASLSKKEIITKATFVFLQPQLSTQLDKKLYKTQIYVGSQLTSHHRAALFYINSSVCLVWFELSLTAFIAKKIDSCRRKSKSWFVSF